MDNVGGVAFDRRNIVQIVAALKLMRDIANNYLWIGGLALLSGMGSCTQATSVPSLPSPSITHSGIFFVICLRGHNIDNIQARMDYGWGNLRFGENLTSDTFWDTFVAGRMANAEKPQEWHSASDCPSKMKKGLPSLGHGFKWKQHYPLFPLRIYSLWINL